MKQHLLTAILAASAAATPLAQAPAAPAVPVSGDNGDMGGIFGMGFGTSSASSSTSGLGSLLSGISSFFGPAKGSTPPKASGLPAAAAPPKPASTPAAAASSGITAMLGGLLNNLDISSLVPTGPEYPKGKPSLQDFYDPGSGPYPAHFFTVPGLTRHTVYAPIKPPPPSLKMPVFIWGNGGCTSSGTPYAMFLTEVASYGYLVIANGPPGGAPPTLDIPRGAGAGGLPGPDGKPKYTMADAAAGGMSTIKDMNDAIAWVVNGNAKEYGNVSTTDFATGGSSCGGLEAYSTAYHNDRVKLIGVYNSGVIMPNKRALLQELKAGVALFPGGPKDMGYENSNADYAALPKNIPAFYASLDSGHLGTFFAKRGGKYGRATVQLFEWYFRGDAKARAAWTDPAAPGGLIAEHWQNVTHRNFN
ncbi:hypothetical protein EJ06DRAFT_520252 [Trichodelitschia bisporula]|uniref:Alpha/beta-hydrolase n=1 Tax=Trichodelitschia bisporula TaxID=703511 RepID=A0A6G1I1K3_9PEZI|nr:hypothetical protein EJ06DRAFT_520252 [Trichodelitschia bisporula]